MTKKALLWVWQLPQNLLGLLVILATGAERISYDDGFVGRYSGYVARRFNGSWSAVSLGGVKRNL